MGTAISPLSPHSSFMFSFDALLNERLISELFQSILERNLHVLVPEFIVGNVVGIFGAFTA